LNKIIGLSLEYYPAQYVGENITREMRKQLIAVNIETLKEQIDQIEAKLGTCTKEQALKDAKFLSANEKLLILKQWQRFITSGFNPQKFTEKLYDHLHLHCGFIAHYDRSGFYYTYWNDELIRFSTRNNCDIVPAPLTFYEWESFLKNFSIWGEYTDINVAMMVVLHYELSELIEKLIEEVKGIYQYDTEYSYRCMQREEEILEQDIQSIKEELQDKSEQLRKLTPESYLKQLNADYEDIFGAEIFSRLEDPGSSQQMAMAI